MEHILSTAALLLAVIGIWVLVSRHQRGRKEIQFITAIKNVLPDGLILEDILFKEIQARGDMRIISLYVQKLKAFQYNGFRGDPKYVERGLYRGALLQLERDGMLRSVTVSHTQLKRDYPESYLLARELGLLHINDDAYHMLVDTSRPSELNDLKRAISESISEEEFEDIHRYTLWELTDKGKGVWPQYESYQARCMAERALLIELY